MNFGVKTNRFGKKSGTKSKPDKKKVLTKTQRLAKKAMKLHHSEGVSLKRAWKMVQKFGNPPELVDYEINPITGRYRKKCREYQERDESGRCRGRKPVEPPPGKEINPETGRLRNICEPPMMRNVRGRCIGSRKDLKPGYIINPKTGRPQLASKEGYYRDPNTNRWRKIPRMPGVEYDVSNAEKNLKRIRANPKIPDDPPVDISDIDMTVFGKKQFRCGFGACNACALKNKFGQISTLKKAAPKKAVPKKAVPKKAAPKKAVPKKAAPKQELPKKVELIKVAIENGVDYNKCTELTKEALYLKLKKADLWPPPAQEPGWFDSIFS
jgi:hypothetical protein